MTSTSPKVQGVCLCGTVRYEIDGPLKMMVHCHCSMCRKHHGSAFATFVSAPLMGFRWTSGKDNIGIYESSEKGRRPFCRTCNSVAPTISKEMDLVFCPAGNLEGDLNLRPEAHWFVGSKAPWYTITDELPRHEEYPEEFATTGVTRPVVEATADVIAGSCLCGDVAYEVKAPLARMVNCHCSRCRRGRSSAHATNAICKIDDLRFVRGESRLRTYKVPEARFFTISFCERCGGAAPLISRERGFVLIPAGTFDTDPGMRPQCHIHVSSKANWFEITDDLPQFEQMYTS
jgi:hypothetical protein